MYNISMKQLLIILALLILSAPSALADYPSVVQIEAGDRLGSGTSVAQGILTNAHVVENLKYVNVCEPNFPFSCKRGKVIKIATEIDLALIKTNLRTKPLLVCQTCVRTQKITLDAFPQGYYARYSTNIERVEGNYFITGHAFEPGASGGAGISDGKLIGIISMASIKDGKYLQSYLIRDEIIRKFLRVPRIK